MIVSDKNIDLVKIGGYAFHCCECDLSEVDEILLQKIRNDNEDDEPMFNYQYFDKRIDALSTCFRMHLSSHDGVRIDCSDAIEELYQEILKELNIKK